MVLGILGTGMIVREALPVLKMFDFEKIYLISTERSYMSALDLKKQYDLADCFTDYDALLAADANIIYVALPNDLHASYAKKALLCGKHVIIEKPAVLCEKDWEELLHIAAENHAKVFEAMSLHALPAFRRLMEDIKNIGKIKIVSLNYSQYSSRYDAFCQGELPVVFDAARGGGALNDINIYNVHAVLALFGKPISSVYYENICRGVDTSGILVMQYSDFHALCIGAKDCNVTNASFIQGEEGTVYITGNVNGMKEYKIIQKDGTDRKYIDKSSEHRLYWEFKEFLRIIREDDVLSYDRLALLSRWSVEILRSVRE